MTKKSKRRLPVILNYFLLAIILVLIGIIYQMRRPQLGLERPSVVEEKQPEVAKIRGTIVLIIDDFGYRNDRVSDGFLELGVPLTCAVIPGHNNSAYFAELAKKAGKEVIVHMPMESHTATRGEEKYVLNTSMTSAEIERRVERAFRELSVADGMNNHQGSKATENDRLMRVVGLTLKRLNKYFLDSRTTAKSIGESVMNEIGVRTGRRLVFLDNEFDPDLIRSQLVELAAKATSQGIAIGIGHAKPNTLSVLQEEIPRLKSQGYRFDFVSKAVK